MKYLKKIVWVFDLDNTLVMTDVANNNAYQEAICACMGRKMIFKQNRFTRNDLYKLFPSLPESLHNEIIKIKESVFSQHLKETSLNKQLIKILVLLKKCGGETVLLTESHKKKVMQVFDHYQLTPLFNRVFCKEDYKTMNKYQFLKEIVPDIQSVVLFENDNEELNRAVQYGLQDNQLITIKF